MILKCIVENLNLGTFYDTELNSEGDGPTRGLLRDYESSDGPSFEALVASSGTMGAKCLLMVLMTPHSPHLGTSPAHSVSLSASPTTAHLTSPQLYLDINTAAKQILQL